ncbi:GNAT family N-acetyltransferase [Deinococcus sp.]|uniref:GNAT family N-acetyltransferase n=1 Tax=Deinococcus sp. TaxID=47478 RepID=UPI003C7C17CC
MTLALCTVLTPEVADLLALAVWPDPTRVQATLARYASDPGLQVWVLEVAGQPVCAAGIRLKELSAEILHLGTREDARRQGYARRLLLALLERPDLTTLEAETDDGSVAFYRRAGFEVRETAARGGSVRYHCTLPA